MNFLTSLKKVLLFDTTINDPGQQVHKQIWNDNRRFALIWSFAALFYWGFCIFMSFREERFYICRNVYIVTIILSALELLATLFLVKKKPQLINLIQFLINATVMGGGLFIAWNLLQNGIQTILIFASVLMTPVLFVSNTLSNIIMVLLDIIAAAILLRNGLSPSTYILCVSDLIIFSSIGVILGHFVNKARFERYAFAESAVQLAESNAQLAELQTRYAYYDQMTGLMNRRAYSEKISELSKSLPDYCCVIMADINGLKKMNDTLGHEAGDELIIGSAECLCKSFDGIETIYRLGGDEFCVILTNPSVDVKKCLERAGKLSAAWKGDYVNGFSVSCGFSSTEEYDDIMSIIHAADSRMYDSKRDYYLSNGNDRRQR